MVLCLGEPPKRFLGCWLSFCCCTFICRCSSFCCCIFICSCSSFCCCSSHCFLTSSLTLPWTIAGFFTPHFILSAQPMAEWFATLSFVQSFRSCRERYDLEWAVFTYRHFLPYAPSQHIRHNLLLSRLPWEPAVIPWILQGFILILETQTRPFRLFDSQ